MGRGWRSHIFLLHHLKTLNSGMDIPGQWQRNQVVSDGGGNSFQTFQHHQSCIATTQLLALNEESAARGNGRIRTRLRDNAVNVGGTESGNVKVAREYG